MIRGRWGKCGQLVVVFAVVLATTAPTALAATGGSSLSAGDSATFDAMGDASSEFGSAQQAPPNENNSSVAHRNPSEVSDEESLDDVELWLSREMANQLSESANVSQEDRKRARELVGNDSEYAQLAEQYAEVANQSGSESGARQAEDFATAGQLQRQFFADVEAYHRLHDGYRDARASDETDRTLRLAHELERRAAEVNRTAARLNESYANISEGGQGDLRNATRTIGEMRANVTRTQQTVRDQTLVRTELSVQATEPDGSFTDPVPLAGRLQTADGEPIADENVTLRVGNRTLNATTDGEGRFEVEYRPTLAPVGERSWTVAFRPGNESAYLWANATATFGVRQIAPSVTVSNRTTTVRYNETLTVNGTVAAEGLGVPDVPVVVTVDGVRVCATRTDADGSFGAAGRLPANVTNGSQTVRVEVAPENATAAALGSGAFGQERDRESDSNAESDRDVAIASANRSAEVTVETTSTSLSITDVQTFNETAIVTGRLTTERSEPLANRTVELRIDGRSVGTATTNATGDYATTVELPSRSLGGDAAARVVADYSPSGGNLAPATATGTAAMGSTGLAISDRQLRFGALGLLVAALGAFVWRSRSSGGSSDEETAQGAGEAGEAGGPQAGTFAGVRGRSAEALFDSATTALEGGKLDAAVVTAYGSVSRQLGDGLDGATPRTHWEFYADCRDAGLSDEQLRRLERLAEVYERAAFADRSVSEADAREAVAVATALREAVDSDAQALDGERSEREQPRGDPGDAGGSPAD